MQHKKTLNRNLFSYLLFLPLVLLTFCTKDDQVVTFSKEGMITKDADVITLIKSVIEDTSNSITKSDSTTDDDKCTAFKFPMTFYLNEELAQPIVINSNEELLDFFNTLNNDQYFYIYFPIVLLDSEGIETIIYDLKELEGTLTMAIDACNSINDPFDEYGDGNNDDDDGNDDSDYQYCDKNNKKVYICHNGHTICVSVNAIWGHLNQHEDDYLGQCN